MREYVDVRQSGDGREHVDARKYVDIREGFIESEKEVLLWKVIVSSSAEESRSLMAISVGKEVLRR